MNDIPDLVHCNIKMFADDTKLFTPVRSREDQEHVQCDIATLEDWTKVWLLEFNADKCKLMQMGRSPPRNYTMTNKSGARVDLGSIKEEKDVGVWRLLDLQVNPTVFFGPERFGQEEAHFLRVFQRRQDGSVDFYRDWNTYKRGFGDVSGEFWLGNDYIHDLTSNRRYELRVDMDDFENESRYAVFSTFAVSSEADKYTMTLGTYSGTAGDSLSYHANNAFSTKDRDNDHHKDSCASMRKGGWWYNSCIVSNLNGIYYSVGKYYPGHGAEYTGTYWHSWRIYDSLRKVEMKIRS
ncbi:Angiopoietin-related protein 7 [Lamellibrachia satsuma]|nr:Angiopoietin-related protein 7 [Lamellibrachia satsuma]